MSSQREPDESGADLFARQQALRWWKRKQGAKDGVGKRRSPAGSAVHQEIGQSASLDHSAGCELDHVQGHAPRLWTALHLERVVTADSSAYAAAQTTVVVDPTEQSPGLLTTGHERESLHRTGADAASAARARFTRHGPV